MLIYNSLKVCGGSGSTIDGFTVMDICCKLKGRFVTIQATDTDSRPLGELMKFTVRLGCKNYKAIIIVPKKINISSDLVSF